MDKKQQTQEQQSNIPQRSEKERASGQSDLNKVGGFNFVETVVDGIANMNPSRKARKEIFLKKIMELNI